MLCVVQVDLAVERIVHQWVRDMLECKQKLGSAEKRVRELSAEMRTLRMLGPYHVTRCARTIEELEAQLQRKVFQVRGSDLDPERRVRNRSSVQKGDGVAVSISLFGGKRNILRLENERLQWDNWVGESRDHGANSQNETKFSLIHGI